jgi:hypothetical protein
MSQTIKKYADLCEERERVKSLLQVQRQKVKADWHDLKDEFLPVKNAFGMVGKFARADKTNPIINATLQVVGDVFLKSFVLAKAGWATKLAVPFVVKNYTSHLLVRKGATFVARLANILSGKKRKSSSAAVAPVVTTEQTTVIVPENPGITNNPI